MAQTTKENTEAKRLYSEGRELYDDGNYADAEKKFREALTRYPRADQSDRSAYYLIITLEKTSPIPGCPGRDRQLQQELPGSRWREDVDERNLALGGSTNSALEQQAKILRERDESAKRGSPELPPNARCGRHDSANDYSAESIRGN
jgi:tetratricopeptide (TPR) repeat protein